MLKKNVFTTSLVAAALCTAFAVQAQGYDRDHDRRDDNRGDHHMDRGHNDHGRAMGNSGYERHEHRQWHRGDRVPDQYRHGGYVVNDWRVRHLHAPPRGYQWVNVDGDLVLVAIATGLIAELALNSY